MRRGDLRGFWMAMGLGWLSALNAFAGEASSLEFQDRVREIALAPTGEYYRVTFRKKAAFYRVEKSNQAAAACLEKSVRSSKEASVRVDGRTLVVLTCRGP